jgi:serine/threonine protein kinase
MRDLVFISYAHEDKCWVDAFNEHLAPAESKGLLRVWSDARIGPGQSWRSEIGAALARSRIGLLLVTPSFIASPFIRNEELRALLAAREKGELSLFWVPISDSLIEVVDLNGLQAAPGCDPARPLNSLSEAERQRTIVTICRRLLEEMGRLPAMTHSDRADLQEQVGRRLGPRYELLGEIGTGSSCIAYRARSRHPDRTVVVKALVSSEVQQDTRDDFRGRAEIAYRLRQPAYMQVHDTLFDQEPYCVVTEFVEGATLDRYVEQWGSNVPPRRVRKILLDLALALAEAHSLDCLHEGLVPSNVHIDSSHRPRVSAFRFLDRGSSVGTWGTFLINHETSTYLSPEQFEGRPRTKATDQYALGLLGYELLSGQRLERVTCPGDFSRRPKLYARLERDGAWTRRAPALGGIISRMLRIETDERWRSMDEVAAVLDGVVVEDSIEGEARRRVLDCYSRFQASDRTEQLCASFYRRLFAQMPEFQRLFVRTDMTRQHAALNRALKLLMDYDPASPATGQAIVAIAQGHQKYGLSEPHLQAFKSALLGALRDTGEIHADLIADWERIVTPGLEFMARALSPPDTRATERSMMVCG